MGAEGGLDGSEPAIRLCIGDGIGEGRAQARCNAGRRCAPERMSTQERIPEEHRCTRRDPIPLESRPERLGSGIRSVAALITRQIDVRQIEDRRLAPTFDVLRVEAHQQIFVDGLGTNARAHDRLDAVDQTTANDGVALVHPQLEGAGVERLVALGRLWVEESHILDEALVDHGVDLGQSDGEGLIEPDRVFDRLVCEGPSLFGARCATQLEGEGLDPLIDLSAEDLDGARLDCVVETRLQREEHATQDQEVKKRFSQQAGPLRKLIAGYRNPMDRISSASASAVRNLALVDRYFDLLGKGDPTIAELFAKNARWLAPQSAPVGRLHEGLAAVLALMASGLGLYDTTRPLQIERTASLAGDELVYIEMTIRATTKQGEPYENHYVMVFQIRDDRIHEVREYVDSLYAQRLLFDPAGQPSPLDA